MGLWYGIPVNENNNSVSDNGQNRHVRLLILGSGPAGCTAALYAARAGLAPVLLTGTEPGGQLTTTTDVENWPGGRDGLQGPELMENMTEQLRRLDIPVINDQVEDASLQEKPFRLRAGKTVYSCDALIIATGAAARYLGLPSESAYLGRGVSACATCDGFFYRGKPVAVIGGGNTAVEEALYLAGIASSVSLIHRRDQLRAENVLVQRLMRRQEEGRIRIIWNHVLEEVLGDDKGVTGLRMRSVTDDKESQLDVHGVFIAIGHTPNTGLFSGQLGMRDDSYIRVRGGDRGMATATDIEGVFAAGDVADPVYRQAVTSAGSGCMAALDAERWLASERSE